MNSCFRQYFIKNGMVISQSIFKLPINFDSCIYEVIRIINGVPLFLEDHINRFEASIKLKNIPYSFETIKSDIKLLLANNLYVDGNIKIELYVNKNELNLFSYYIEHHYPSDFEYKNGVQLKSIIAERSIPNVKIVHNSIKLRVDKILEDKSLYEVLLVNNQDLITEGSRSNIYFLKLNKIYTAPGNLVLMGITRKYVLKVIQSLNLEIVEEPVLFNDIGSFDGAFLSGTSPKILPINKIDEYRFNTKLNIYSLIYDRYAQIIKEYIEQHKLNSNL